MKHFKTRFTAILIMLIAYISANAQFIHPGLSHKMSDLDRMKAMVEAKEDPWYSSYQDLISQGTASYSYVVQGDTSLKEVYRDAPRTNKTIFENDSRAAYYNALRWYIEGDERYAQKAVECLNAWSGLTYIQYSGTSALTSNMIIIMLEAAEIMKNTYDGWSPTDIQRFKDMLVYPGYSSTTIPDNLSQEGTWYWRAYKFDPIRAGNQELCAIRTTMAIGVFLDDERIYDRAWRYINSMDGREDDIPFPRGPHVQTSQIDSNQYRIAYNIEVLSEEPNFHGNGALVNYIYETGQAQESSRDQAHTSFGIGLLASIGEISWNQGDDLWGSVDSRILLGLEYSLRYNVSFVESYPDQPSPWEPSVATGEFIQKFDATLRSKALSICPVIDNCETCLTRGNFPVENTWELPIAHYVGRGLKTPEEVKWTIRARDYSIIENGRYETGPSGGAYVGYGGLSFRRPEGCYGDPISGFDANGVPVFAINNLPVTIEAENYDYFNLSGAEKTYYDTSAGNTGSVYRNDEGVDLAVCSEGGYQVTDIAAGEWLAYTINVPIDGTYDIAIRYAAASADGTVKFNIGGADVTTDVAVPFGAPNSTGVEDWQTLIVAEDVALSQGVQPMKVFFNGGNNAFELNNINIELNSIACRSQVIPDETLFTGINYKFYEGTWNELPDFELLTPTDIGSVDSIDVSPAMATDNFGLLFEGYWSADTDGDYTFYLNSDGGSRLTIDGLVIVDNDSIHGLIEESGVICLDSGLHQIQVEYFEQAQGSILEVMYDGPNTSKGTLTGFSAEEILKSIPGLMEAEDFTSNGGVEIEDTADEGGGGQIGFVNSGDFITFDTYVQETGIYKFGFRVASNGVGGAINIKDGDTILGSVTIPVTGGWNNWQTFYLPNIELEEGYQNLKFEFAGEEGYLFNLNWILGEESFFEIPTRLEAEQFTAQSGVTIESTSDEDGGSNISLIEDGDYIAFDVTVSEPDTYQVGFRISARGQGGSVIIKSDESTVGQVTIPATGNWNTWETINTIVQLDSGVQTLKFEFAGGSGYLFNMNWIDFDHLPNLPGRLEAEAYASQSGVNTQATSDSEGEEQVGWINDGDHIAHFVNVLESDTYVVNFRLASAAVGSSIVIKSDSTVVGEIVVPDTGGMNTWQTVKTEIDLNAGVQTLTFEFVGGSGYLLNLNWIEFNKLPSIPGRLEAEEFSSQFGVITETSSDSDDGEQVSMINNGDYIGFTVNVLDSDTYIASFRIASANDSSSIIVKSDSVIIDEIAVPNTGSMSSWTTVKVLMDINAGKQNLTFEFVGGSGDLFNLNWMEFFKAPVIPGRIEAEDYFSQVGIQTQATSDSGGGDNVGWVHNGDYISFNVDVQTSGVYNVSYRASSGTSGGSIALKKDGVTLDVTDIPNTNGWNSWRTYTTSIPLDSGLQTLDFELLGGGGYLFNLNWIEFEYTGLNLNLTARKSGTSTDNHIKTYFEIANTGVEALNLDDLTVRYWFTAEEYASLNFWCDYAQIGSSNVNATFHSSEPLRVGGYHYMDVNFTSGLELLPGTNTGEIRTRFAKSDWTDFDESNDYSYQDTDNFMVNKQITVYKDSTLIWGIEPLEEASVMSFEVLHKSSDSWAPNDNQIKPRFDIKNTGNTSVALSDIKLRYWFSPEGTEDINFWIDWAQMGSQYVNGATYAIDSTSDKYLELTFSSADQLWGLSSTGEIQTRMAKVNWTTFDETNDHSYVSTSSYQTNDHITIYVNDELVSGTEPLSVANQRSNNNEEQSISDIAHISMYPNPIRDRGTVELAMEEAGSVSLQMISITGKIVSLNQVDLLSGSQQVELDVSDLEDGVYLLRVIKEGKISNIRFAVLH